MFLLLSNLHVQKSSANNSMIGNDQNSDCKPKLRNWCYLSYEHETFGTA